MKIKLFIITFTICILAGYSAIAQATENNIFIVNNSYDGENIDIGYPAVDEIERQILGKVYSSENIYSRLDRLDKTAFGNVTNSSLQDRVDKLSNFTRKNRNYSSNNTNANMNFSQNYSSFNSSTNEYSVVLHELEKNFFGTVYPNESVNNRLVRLENKVFDSSSEDYSTPERIQRLSAYADAQQSNDFFEDQQQLRQYNNIANGAKVISILFMILQAFLQ